ncbi:rho GTPase-activating protein 12 [Caerostris darwini]|uniref:Rho GTPase-activating protein 12 n=1 Tax=Caerostris darwini TaxID=1538125 RepID=A0AAV4WPQ3_9ARAC|nr:rho GTPase-activating protein 12 [Caerostris darwini]
MSDVYVQVLYDFHYRTENGEEVTMKAGEELLLLKKSNENWWQVIRDSDNNPFYAPSNYLSIIGLNCKESIESTDVNSNIQSNNSSCSDNQNNIALKSKCIIDVQKNVNKLSKSVTENLSIKKVTDALSFKNPLCENEFLSNDHDHDDSYQKPVLLTNELPSKTECENEISTSYDSSLLQDSMSPIYVNIPVSFGRLPPSPKPDQKPIRKLTNDWFEYLEEESGRKYYFHSASGKVTWKPPRRHENMQSTPLSSEPSSPKSISSLNAVPDPPPKQLKPKLKKLAHSSNESLESQSSPCMFTILPPGWSEESDSNGAVYYHHGLSKKKWYASADENGRTYFYDEDNSESLWELPDISISSDLEESKQSQVAENALESSGNTAKDEPAVKSANESLTSPKLRKKAPKLPIPRQFKTRSLIVPECVNLSSTEDNRGFLPPSFGEGYWPSVQDGHFSITRKGTLNKTKLVEGGKRIRKNWTTSFVVLTDVFLLFYKDIRSAHLATPGVKPELCIDLNGALVEWCPDKSSRKNVFQISTVLGHQLLLQDDNAQTTREWFETIQAAIMMLPSSLEQADSKYSFNREDNGKKDIKLSRSKSTKHYTTGKSDVENEVVLPAEKKRKIRDKLRQFFVRRPTQESLREKGILLDEPVFGCHLETLCARENRKVPKFVSTCIEVIEDKELTADGLYRASGNLSQVQKIRIHVNQDDYSCLTDEEDVHVLTGALKMFFREMKEPLFPFNMFDKFLNAIALPDASSKLEALKRLVHKMPEPNHETLRVLLEHLLRVTEYHKQNRMQVQNLAIVFGPTLMWPEQVSANIALDMMHQNRIVEFLLLEYNAIFNFGNFASLKSN